MARALLTPMVLAVIVLAAGCGAATPHARTTLAPKVAFVWPLPHAVLSGPVTAQVRVDDFVIAANSVGEAARAGEGHLQFSMDGGRYDLPKYSGANGEMAVKLGSTGRYSPSVKPEITYRNLPAGPHTLRVVLANNDSSSAGPTAAISFTVR